MGRGGDELLQVGKVCSLLGLSGEKRMARHLKDKKCFKKNNLSLKREDGLKSKQYCVEAQLALCSNIVSVSIRY